MSLPNYTWHAEAWRLAHAAIARGAHALLIAGMRGLGKREFALQLGTHYLCGANPAGNAACGVCESCRWLAAGTHPDFVLIEPPSEDEETEASNATAGVARAKPISVDQIRQLDATMALSAHRSAGKVVIIRPAERMNLASANALLKNLEEPPAGVLFVLVTDHPTLLLPTVKSRCHSIRMHLDDPTEAEAWLLQQGCEDPALQLALCGGAPVDALSLASDGAWRRRREFLERLVAESDNPLGLAERFRELPPAVVLSWLQKWTFDLLLTLVGGRTRYHVDMQQALAALADKASATAVSRAHRALLRMQRHVHHPLNPRLFLEHMLMTYQIGLRGEAPA